MIAKDVNMQHMTMTEYVSIAILSEMVNNSEVNAAINKKKIRAAEVVELSFSWADLWMEERAKRKSNEA